MSIIELSAYVIAQRNEKNEINVTHGKPIGTTEDNRPIIEMPSVKLPTGKESPAGLLIMLYGFRDAIDEIKRQRDIAASMGVRDGVKQTIFGMIKIGFEVGEIYPGVVHPEQLPNLRFANVRRMSADLQKEILRRFEKYVAEEGGDIAEMRRVQQIASRPDLFGRLLKDKMFKHLDILVAPVEMREQSGVSRLSQYAFVNRSAVPVEVDQNVGSEISIALPKNLLANAS